MSGALAWQVKKLILNKKKILWVLERRSHGLLFFPGISSPLCVSSCLCSISLPALSHFISFLSAHIHSKTDHKQSL
uniref:Uncharacterized protein At2g18440 n=1 Tax=Arabidopsis thaliana TaxID=3702 RepID=Q570W9_ARATH|nr:hypothetical protein [Arabidopsis thaliana]